MWVVGGVSFELSHEILLVETQLQVSELVILRVLIRVLLRLHDLSAFVQNVHVLLREVHLSVQDCWHVEFSDKPLSLLHNLPRISFSVLQSDSAS